MSLQTALRLSITAIRALRAAIRGQLVTQDNLDIITQDNRRIVTQE
jgi:hypothetical protein